MAQNASMSVLNRSLQEQQQQLREWDGRLSEVGGDVVSLQASVGKQLLQLNETYMALNASMHVQQALCNLSQEAVKETMVRLRRMG